MRILYISHKVPYPLSDGGKLRVFNQIKHLSKKQTITSLSFIEKEDELNGIGELKKYCSVETVLLPRYRSLINSFFGLFSREPLRVWYYKNREFSKKALLLAKSCDLVNIQSPEMMQYAFEPDKTILDAVDTPSLQIERAIKYDAPLWKLIWAIELPRMKKYEQDVCKKIKTVLAASKADKNALGKGIVLKNGTIISKVNRKNPSGNNIIFLGNMEYKPNVDAVSYFVKDIFPLVKQKVADAKFYVVGKSPENIKKYSGEDVVITGFADDLNEFFSKCKVFVAPLRLGSGIQNKVLEALNYEIPVVATSLVNEGLEAKNGKEILIANKPDEFANKVVKLLQDQKLRKRLSSNGKKLLRKNYSWDKINGRLDKIIKNQI